MTVEYKRMQQLRGSSAEWTEDNIVPFDGEIALERAPSGVRVKIGDGVTPYDVLPYVLPSPPFMPQGSIDAVTEDPPAAVPGDVWVNTGTGNVKASWGAPAAGLAAVPGDLLLMDDANDWNLIPTASDLAGYVRESDLAAPGGAALVGYQQSGTGAVARTALAKMREVVTPQDFGAIGDNVADDTAALNRFLVAVATGRSGHIPSGTYKFTAALTPIGANNISITGDDAALIYAGVSTTPGTLISIGDGVTAYDNIHLSGFRLDSATSLTAGTAISINGCRQIYLDIKLDGPDDVTLSQLWDGLLLPASQIIYLNRSRFTVKNTAVKWINGILLHCGEAFIKGRVVAGHGSGIGLHLAGGCADLRTEAICQIQNDIGCKVDNSVSPSPNQHLFFHKAGSFDSNKTAGLLLNDGTAATISKFIDLDAMFASCTAGSGVVISSWAGGRIDCGAGRMINNSASGIYSADSSCTMNISDGAMIGDNHAYGVDAAANWAIKNRAQMYNNALGHHSPSIFNNGLVINNSPFVSWGVDFTTGGPTTIAAGAHATFPAGSGLVILMNQASGDYGMFFCAKGGITKMFGDASMVSGAPAASQIGLNFSGGFYRVTNGFAASQNVFISNFRNRDAA